jgi:tetratricopeptide (TPR) repeat protein
MNRIIVGYVLAGGALFVLLLLAGFDIQRFSSWVPYSHFLSFTRSDDPLVTYAQAYTLFSPYHFVDLFNLIILLAPFSLYMIWKHAVSAAQRTKAPVPQTFLVIAILPVIAFLFFVKFDLGAARDWDVFAPYALLAGLLAAVMYLTKEDVGKVRSAVAIILVTLLNSFFFFLVNSDPHASVSRYASFFDRRVMSQNGYYGGSLQLAMYYREMKNRAEPLRIWEAYADEFPDDDRGYQNIVQNLVRENNDAEILGVYEKWFLHDPENATMKRDFKQFALGAGNRNFANGDLTTAGTYYTVALKLDPGDPRACNNLGSVFAEQREYAQAITMFTRAIAIDSPTQTPFTTPGRRISTAASGRREFPISAAPPGPGIRTRKPISHRCILPGRRGLPCPPSLWRKAAYRVF